MQRASILAAVVATGLVACSDPSEVDVQAAECNDYCDLITAHCTGTLKQYSDRNSCLATCGAMPLGDATSHAGHSVMCRTFTAALAENDPMTTCTKAGPGGDGACGGNCESFCAMADVLCTGANQSYATVAECMTACAAFPTTPPYSSEVTGGNSLACRLYHLTAASTDPVTHCVHLKPADVFPCGG